MVFDIEFRGLDYSDIDPDCAKDLKRLVLPADVIEYDHGELVRLLMSIMHGLPLPLRPVPANAMSGRLSRRLQKIARVWPLLSKFLNIPGRSN